ncbi:MAG TPA: hypothetical protein VE153_31190 [Myxococcus sp.]|nr:hypothetical protein [Myxococcus sp.]
MPLLTRKKLAGVVLALALAGALSAGVASGVERVRGKARKRPEPPPPFSQRDRVKVEPRVHAHPSAGVADSRREAVEKAAPVVRDVPAVAPSRVERSAEPMAARAVPAGGGSESVEREQEAHAHGASVAGLTARIPAPMRVGWTVVESGAGRVRLVAEVERRLGFGAPVRVSLSLPGGATLLEGPAEFTVPGGPGGDVQAVPYVVSFGAGSSVAEDMVLVAHAEGRSFGAHAEARHAFGRVPADVPRPVPTGPALPASLMSGSEQGEPGQGEELP